jgi:hypothetical protein
MSGLSFLIWSIVSTVLMGTFVLVVVAVPMLAEHEMILMIPAVVLGLVVAIPFSYLITKKLKNIGVVKK